jgi:hypothetical protein
MLNDIIKFKVHIQKNLEDYEGFVVDEVEHELGGGDEAQNDTQDLEVRWGDVWEVAGVMDQGVLLWDGEANAVSYEEMKVSFNYGQWKKVKHLNWR